MPKINIEPSLYDRAKKASDAVGYSGVDEFVAHCVEQELKRLKIDEMEDKVSEQLRGLGYLE